MFTGWTDIFLPTVFLFFASPFYSICLLSPERNPPPPPIPPDWEAEDQITVGGSLARWQRRGQGGGGMEGDQISRFQHSPPSTPSPSPPPPWRQNG